jgi:hypothetical protein
MPRIQVLDTFPAFEKYWKVARHEPTDSQIDMWQRVYLSHWPELLDKLKLAYSVEGYDWNEIARTRIFPHLEERLPRMRQLHQNLLRLIPVLWGRTRSTLELDFQVRFVIYVGIGIGAGWATTYEG